MFLDAIQEELKKQGYEVNLSNIAKEEIRCVRDIDLVYTGLNNIMSIATKQVINTNILLNKNLRMAEFVNVLERINNCHDNIMII